MTVRASTFDLWFAHNLRIRQVGESSWTQKSGLRKCEETLHLRSLLAGTCESKSSNVKARDQIVRKATLTSAGQRYEISHWNLRLSSSWLHITTAFRRARAVPSKAHWFCHLSPVTSSTSKKLPCISREWFGSLSTALFRPRQMSGPAHSSSNRSLGAWRLQGAMRGALEGDREVEALTVGLELYMDPRSNPEHVNWTGAMYAWIHCKYIAFGLEAMVALVKDSAGSMYAETLPVQSEYPTLSYGGPRQQICKTFSVWNCGWLLIGPSRIGRQWRTEDLA